MPEEREKKEKVLHARIPESLDDEIREHAAQLGLSVSNLVRNVLQNALGLVDEIISDSAGVARSATGGGPGVGLRRRSRRRAEAAGRVLGWQEVVLNVNAVCESCNTILEKGARGAIAVIEGTGPRPIRCLGCIEETHDEDDGRAGRNERS